MEYAIHYLPTLHLLNRIVITPHACARGKVISRVVNVVVSTKIAISRDVGIYATRKHNELVEFGEIVASV